MIYNGVLIPAVQQSDSTIHTRTSFFKSSFPLRFIAEYRIQFSVLYSRTLFIYLLYMYSFPSNGGQVGCLSWHSCSRLSAYSTISAKLMREGASLVAQMVKKKSACNVEVGSIPGFHPWLLTPVFLLGKSYGHSPWDRKESDTTERLTHTRKEDGRRQ